jgi:hypothetical protein
LSDPTFDHLLDPDRFFDKVEIEVLNKSDKIISNFSIQIQKQFSGDTLFWRPKLSGDFLTEKQINDFQNSLNELANKSIIFKFPDIKEKSSIKLIFNGDFDNVDSLDLKISSPGISNSITKIVEVEDGFLIQFYRDSFFRGYCIIMFSLFVLWILVVYQEPIFNKLYKSIKGIDNSTFNK